jgi:DNA-binding MarR family transcriptional regulator
MTAELPPLGAFPPDSDLGSAIWRAQRAVERAADACLAGLGLTTAAVRVFRQLTHHPGQSAADLARRLGLAPQTVAQVVTAAVERGLVARRPHPFHGRVLQVFLTPAGQQKYRQAGGAIADLEHALSTGMDEAARELFWRELRAITDRAEAISGRATGQN